MGKQLLWEVHHTEILTVARDGGREIVGHSVDGTRVSGFKMSAPILLTGVTGDWQGGVIRVPYPYTYPASFPTSSNVFQVHDRGYQHARLAYAYSIYILFDQISYLPASAIRVVLVRFIVHCS